MVCENRRSAESYDALVMGERWGGWGMRRREGAGRYGEARDQGHPRDGHAGAGAEWGEDVGKRCEGWQCGSQVCALAQKGHGGRDEGERSTARGSGLVGKTRGWEKRCGRRQQGAALRRARALMRLLRKVL